jgi:hypothetical protein
MAAPPLPPGFTLDPAPNAQQVVPPLPADFTLDAPADQSPPERPGYFANLKNATEKAGATDNNNPLMAIPGMGEALLNAGTSAIAPVPGAIDTMLARLGIGHDKNSPDTDYATAKSEFIYQPRSANGQARAEQIGALLRPVNDALAWTGKKSGDAVLNLTGNSQLAKDAEQGVPDLIGAATMKAPEAAGAIKRSVTERAAIAKEPPPPTKTELADQASAAYKRADDSGIVVTPDSFNAVKQRIVQMAQKDGIDPALHPDATAALARIAQSDGSLSLQQLETLRKISSDAEGSIKPADARLASKMTDELDDYIDSLTEKDVVAGDASKSKALKEARDLYSRKKKTDVIDQLMNRAELSAPNFSGSGMENAIRTEFRSLAKNERRMKRFTPEEQAAIRKVAQGGAVDNAMRLLGKLAPTGAVSGAISGGLGFAAGGPVGAVAVPLGGLAARQAATRMTTRNARLAQELMRRGPRGDVPAPQAQAPANSALPSNVFFLPRPTPPQAPNSQMPQDLAASLSPDERRRRAMALMLMQQGR